jgi:uncharacterized protein YqjF (DUF2071 family)
MFLGDWQRALFIHYETDPATLQSEVPFELDLFHGRALVSVVAFSMRRFRPFYGGPILGRLFAPVANHEFLNVRTYVTVNGRSGIHFIIEWVNNKLSLLLGPRLYGLPYRYGEIHLDHNQEGLRLAGSVARSFSYETEIPSGTEYGTCERGSIDEFLLERYSAFTDCRGMQRYFDIRHEPWPQCAVDVKVEDALLCESGSWFGKAEQIGANYSPGVRDIWMGWPRRLRTVRRQCFATAGSI